MLEWRPVIPSPFPHAMMIPTSRPARTAAALLAALLVAAPARGAGAPAREGTPVAEVRIAVRGDLPVDESIVRSFLATAPGAEYTRNAVGGDVRALLDSRRFSYASVLAEAGAEGTVVTYTVEPRRTLAAEPTYRGLHEFSRSKLTKTANLKPGDFIDEPLAAAAAERIRALYRQRRYFDARVSASLAPVPGNPGAAYAVFDIDEGEHGRMAFLEFPGATSLSPDDLGRTAQLHDWYNPVSWVVNPRISETDLDAVAGDARRQYLDAGFLDAKVSPPRVLREGRTIRTLYDVSEGPVYHVGSLSLEGATLFPASAILASLPLRAGDVAGAKAMDEASAAIREYYTSRGYLDTAVTLTTFPAAAPAHALDLVFHVREGSLVRIRNVNVRGNQITKDKVLRREIGLNPGDTYDAVQAERSRRRLQNLGYFSDVRLYDAPVGEGVRDVFYEVDEQRTGNLQFGAGFSSVDHLIGIFGVSQSNFDLFNWPTFRGGGQKARLDLQASRDSTDLDISFVEPWFLDRRLNLDVDLFIHNRSYSEYDERRVGGSVGLAKMVPWVGRVGLDYGLEYVSLDNVTTESFYLADDPTRNFSYLDEDDGYLLGSLRLSWLYDTRDAPLVPHRGTRATAHAKLFSSAFGSEYDFYELNARAFQYFTLPFGFLLSLSGRVATVDGIGGDPVPIGSRYFLGGGRNVRGFRHRAIGPKALSRVREGDYSPVGGQSMLWGTAEVSLPILEKLRLAAFYDIGNVWADAYDWDLGESFASSWGVGLRLDFIGFPIRLDYATPVKEPDEWARKRRFVFWVGFDN